MHRRSVTALRLARLAGLPVFVLAIAQIGPLSAVEGAREAVAPDKVAAVSPQPLPRVCCRMGQNEYSVLTRRECRGRQGRPVANRFCRQNQNAEDDRTWQEYLGRVLSVAGQLERRPQAETPPPEGDTSTTAVARPEAETASRETYLRDLDARAERARREQTLDVGGLPAVVMEVMQIEGPPDRAAIVALQRKGVTIEEHLGGTAYLVSVRALPGQSASGALSAVRGSLRGGRPLSPALKITPNVALMVSGEEQDSGTTGPLEMDSPPPERKQSLTVVFSRTIHPLQARAILRSVDVEVIDQLSRNSFQVIATPPQSARLVKIPYVKTVDMPPPEPIPLLDGARHHANVDPVQKFVLQQGRPKFDGLSGLGIRIGVADTGIHEHHPDLFTISGGNAARHSRVDPESVCDDYHGTHVASIIAGSGLLSEPEAGLSPYTLRGMAPRARLGDFPMVYSDMAAWGICLWIEQEDKDDKIQILSEAVLRHAMDVINNSYVQNLYGVYDETARSIDEIIRGDASHGGRKIPARPQVWSAGNNGVEPVYGNRTGYYSAYTSAKNSISVGSVDADHKLSVFSSLGPTFDGRIKPDIVAPGCGQTSYLSTEPPQTFIDQGQSIQAATIYVNGSNAYVEKCGTSMAAPVVTGIIALMMERHRQPSGEPRHLRPSTYKAILIQTATDLEKTEAEGAGDIINPDTRNSLTYHKGPDYATGYGLVNGAAAVHLIADKRRWEEGSLSESGASKEYCLRIPENAGEVKVTLAWDDKPASPLSNPGAQGTGGSPDFARPALVDDLDITLKSPSGDSIHPWILEAPAWSGKPNPASWQDTDPIEPDDIKPAKRGTDRLNNVEMVSTSTPEPGIWKLRVEAHRIQPIGDSPAARFSLASSHPIRTQCSP